MEKPNKNPKKDWMCDLMYEEGSNVPFITVPENKDMPRRLFVYEFKMTGEYEPGPDGQDAPKMDAMIHQYFDYDELAKVLDAETLDKVRLYFGLERLEEARKKGSKLVEKVESNVKEETNEKQIH